MELKRDTIITGIKHFSITVTVIICIISMQRCHDYKDNADTVDGLYKASQDSLHQFKNKLGEEVSKTETLTSENTELFLSLQFKDKTIQNLQKLVARYEDDNKQLSSALFIANSTIVYFADSIKNLISGWEADSNKVQYPIYKRAFTITDCFTSGTVELGLHKFDISLQTDNQYEIAIGEERVGLFKKKQFAEITNKNKCTTTKAMRVYDKQEKKTNLWKPAAVGVAVGILIAKILF